jgi:membrane fusion protein (multidrug efflux system)
MTEQVVPPPLVQTLLPYAALDWNGRASHPGDRRLSLLAGRRTGFPLGSGKTHCNGAIGTAAGPTPSELDSAPVDVQVTKPTRRDLVYTVKLPANVSPLYQTTLYAKVAGYLKWIGPDKGDAVKKNEVVAVIDAPEVEEQYQQAVSDYKIKKLTYERLAKVWKESPDVIAKQDVDVAEAAYQGARHLMEQRVVMRDYTKSARPTTASSPPASPIPARSFRSPRPRPPARFRSLRSWTSTRFVSMRTSHRTTAPGSFQAKPPRP